jgi:hypothetical protein
VRQALLSGDHVARMGAIALAPVRHHHARIVSGNALLHFLLAMWRANLGDGHFIRIKRPQRGGTTPNAPARVSGMDRALRNRGPQAGIGLTDLARRTPQGVLRDGSLCQGNPPA